MEVSQLGKSVTGRFIFCIMFGCGSLGAFLIMAEKVTDLSTSIAECHQDLFYYLSSLGYLV